MAIATIDHQNAIDRFRELLADDSPYRVLRLTGGTLLGKTHLVAHVFKEICETQQRAYAILDLREVTTTIPDHLHDVFSALRRLADFRGYEKAREELLPIGASVSGTYVLSIVRLKARRPDIWEIGRRLTVQLAKDLESSRASFVVLVDTVERAPEETQRWLVSHLVTELARLPGARIVLAGQTLLPAPASYKSECSEYELRPVTEVEAYVHYCRETNLPCALEDIPKFISLLEYLPGLFAQRVPRLPAHGTGS